MGEFVASNGGKITYDAAAGGATMFDGSVDAGWPNSRGLSPFEVQMLREFFVAERDAQLGRWRWPEMFGVVAYPQPDGSLKVLDEVTLSVGFYRYRSHATVGNSLLARAARAYFEAHPESKPWHGAKPGEVWMVTFAGEPIEYLAIVSQRFGEGKVSNLFVLGEDDSFPVDDVSIVSASRVRVG